MSFTDKPVIERVLWGIIAISVLIFAVSYAFGQYVQYKQSTISTLDAWMECVRTEQFTDKAYEFCQAKCSENYMFKKHFDWGDGRPDTDD